MMMTVMVMGMVIVTVVTKDSDVHGVDGGNNIDGGNVGGSDKNVNYCGGDETGAGGDNDVHGPFNKLTSLKATPL